MEWLITNWPYLGCGILGLIILATVVVKLTPTTKDDGVIGKIIEFLGKYVSLVMTDRQKQLLEQAEKIHKGEVNNQK